MVDSEVHVKMVGKSSSLTWPAGQLISTLRVVEGVDKLTFAVT